MLGRANLGKVKEALLDFISNEKILIEFCKYNNMIKFLLFFDNSRLFYEGIQKKAFIDKLYSIYQMAFEKNTLVNIF